MQPGLYNILFISAALFFIGVYGFLTRRNLITMLMSIELLLNSVNLNFIAFNKYLWPGKMDGLFFTVFIIAIAAAEAAVAIAIIINLYRSHHSIDVENAGNAVSDLREDPSRDRQSERFIIASCELSCPGIEKLYNLCARFNLKAKIGNDR